MLNEMILHPLPERFRDSLRAEPLDVLVRTLAIQSARERPDFEVLFGAGQIIRQEQVAGVDAAVATWLEASDLPRRWDVAACFLMGYWIEPVRPEAVLVALLLQQLEQMDAGEGGWNEMLRALAAAAFSTDSAVASRIRDALRLAVARADPARIQHGTAAALEAVLET